MNNHSKTNEQALEAAIEKALTGTCLEEIKAAENVVSEEQILYRSGNGYYVGHATDFNAEYAIDEKRFWHFLESTQKEELAKLQRSSDWKLKIKQRYNRMVKKYGILRLLRKGLEIEDAEFTLLYQTPLASSSQTVKDNFEKKYHDYKNQSGAEQFLNELPNSHMKGFESSKEF